MLAALHPEKWSRRPRADMFGFGGSLGVAEKYHPQPWASLDYDEGVGVYIVNFTERQLRAAPSDSIDALTANDGLDYCHRSFD
jgi:hypothetical protein